MYLEPATFQDCSPMPALIHSQSNGGFRIAATAFTDSREIDFESIDSKLAALKKR